MNKSSSELKSMAKGALLGQYGTPILAYLIIFAVSFVLNLLLLRLFPYYGLGSLGSILSYFLCSLIMELLLSLLTVGLQILLLNMARGYSGNVGDVFFAFRNQPDKIILYQLCMVGIFLLCMLPSLAVLVLTAAYSELLFLRVICVLVFLVDIVFTVSTLLSYVLVPFLYGDEPELGTLDLLRRSKELMRGHRCRYFYLSVSFLGMTFLAFLSLFIGFLWVAPYMNMTYAQFYRNVRGEI